MCLIAVKEIGKNLPSREKLFNGFQNNSDGVGIALLKKEHNTILIKKDFKDFEDFYAWAITNISINDIAVIHFRFATSGKVDIGNRHPFPITHNSVLLRKAETFCRFALAHNGVLSEYSGHKKYSDTQKFIVDIIAGLKYKLDNPSIQKLIVSYIGSDKLAIIDALHRKTILLGEYKTCDEGILWSNDGYTYNRKDYSNNTSYTNNKYVVCDLCESKKKVMWVDNERAFLCKKCRRGIKKHGWDKWYDRILSTWEDDDKDFIKDTEVIYTDKYGKKTHYDVNLNEIKNLDELEYEKQRKILHNFAHNNTKDYTIDKHLCDVFNSLTEKEKKRVCELVGKGKDFEKAIGQIFVEIDDKANNLANKITKSYNKSRKRKEYYNIIDDTTCGWREQENEHYSG